jgi:hypothetical protein
MSEALKVFLVMCAWALAARLGLSIIPHDTVSIAVYAALALLALIWLVPAAMMSFDLANRFLRLTLGIWLGTALLAGVVSLAIARPF